MFSVIIPTAQKNLSIFNRLLKEIENSDLVNEIIIINNHAKKLTDLNFSKTRILEQGKNIYVNPAWNLGVEEAKNEYIAILNDDIYIPKELFKKIYEFIFKNKNCGLIGLDSLKISQTNDVSNTEEEFIANIYPTDVRNFCWGSGIFGKKDNFYKIPNDLKIWYGDDYLFEQNKNNKKINYKIASTSIKHYHSLTSGCSYFNDVKNNDSIAYQKYVLQNKNNIKKHKTYRILGIKFNIKQNNKFDLFISMGAACSCAQILIENKLRRFSCPFDWLYGSNIINRANILANDFKDFINKEDLEYFGLRQSPEPRKIYKNTKNNLVFNYDFSYNNTLDEDYPAIYKKYKRRINRLIKTIKNSKNICLVYIQTPNDRKEILDQELLNTHQILANKFPKTKIHLLHLFCERGLEYKNASRFYIEDKICKIRFDYDAYNPEFPYLVSNEKLNKLFKEYKLPLKHVLFKTISQNVFSIKNINNKQRKVIKILGIKVKLKNKTSQQVNNSNKEKLELQSPNVEKCGKYTYCTTQPHIATRKTIIGSFCSIGKNVQIGHGEHPLNFLSTSPYFYFDALGWKTETMPSYNEYWGYKPVKIGNDVWIGDNVVIKNGINIGDGAVIGLNSVVTKDIPPYAIVAGVPARIIKYRFDKKKQ